MIYQLVPAARGASPADSKPPAPGCLDAQRILSSVFVYKRVSLCYDNVMVSFSYSIIRTVTYLLI